MSNMGYCRFENTVSDMNDCVNHLHDGDEDMSDYERAAKQAFIEICKDVAAEFSDVDDYDQEVS